MQEAVLIEEQARQITGLSFCLEQEIHACQERVAALRARRLRICTGGETVFMSKRLEYNAIRLLLAEELRLLDALMVLI